MDEVDRVEEENNIRRELFDENDYEYTESCLANEEAISDHGDLKFLGFQLAVKEVNTKIFSYPDLVNIELSTSSESLADEKIKRHLGLCETLVTKSHGNLNEQNHTTDNDLSGHFNWTASTRTSSCPDLSRTCHATPHHSDSRKNVSDSQSGDSQRLDACRDSDDEDTAAFDCANFFMLLKTLGENKFKSHNTSSTNTKDKIFKFYDLTLQDMFSRLTHKLKDDVNLLHCNLKEWGMELTNVVGDTSTLEEINKNEMMKRRGCMPTFMPFVAIT